MCNVVGYFFFPCTYMSCWHWSANWRGTLCTDHCRKMSIAIKEGTLTRQNIIKHTFFILTSDKISWCCYYFCIFPWMCTGILSCLQTLLYCTFKIKITWRHLLDSFLLPLNSKYDLNRIKWLYFKMFHIHALKIILDNDLMLSIHPI